MELWKSWLIGIVIAIITRMAITIAYEKRKNVSKYVKLFLHLLAVISIVLAFGMPSGLLVGMLLEFEDIINIIFFILLSIVIYLLAFFMLGLYNMKCTLMQIVYILAFAISLAVVAKYNMYYRQNVKEVTETVLQDTKTMELEYFNNMNLQEIVKELSEESKIPNKEGLLNGTPASSIITFSYVDENNQTVYSNALVGHSKIEYIEDDEKPYVQIYSYYKYTKLIDCKTGTEKIKGNTEKEWKQYCFYLPEAVLKYEP